MLLMLFACVQDIILPEMGECALSPDVSFDFGEAGIGTCLSGPNDLLFLQKDNKTQLVVSNSNPYLNFTTGSVLMIDWEGVDTTNPLQFMHELDANAFPVDSFGGSLASDGTWIALSSRYSEDARDLTDPASSPA